MKKYQARLYLIILYLLDCFDASEYTSKSIMNAESSKPLQLEQGWKTSNGKTKHHSKFFWNGIDGKLG